MGASWDFDALGGALRRAAFDGELWPSVLAEASATVGGSGALLFQAARAFPQASPDMVEMRDDYLREGWDCLDERYGCIPLLLHNGVVTDLDYCSSERINASAYYQDFLIKRGYGWFAGIGFKAAGDLWVLSIQRTLAQGPFVPAEVARLKQLWQPFADAATLSRQIDSVRVAGAINGIEAIGHAAIVCDHRGHILQINANAERLLGQLIDPRGRTLVFRDPISREAYEKTLAAAIANRLVNEAAPASCQVLDAQGEPLTMRAITLRDLGCFLAPNGAVLLLLRPAVRDLATLFRECGLTSAEASVCEALTKGHPVDVIARLHKVKPATVRTQLKSIYAKTGVHKQAQLVTFLGRHAAPASLGEA
jgi:DNA-binding CsgD family transcriptional regulator